MTNNNDKSLGAVPALVRIASDTKTQSLLDTFCITPQNITMRAHGTLVGFFRVYDVDADTDIDTAYVCNFLTSVAKKEYYATTRRTPEESLEAALTKVNHALAELCSNGNTDWLTGLDGAIVVLTDKAVHFSVCGAGRISLWRGGRITHISDGFVEGAINPLAVFSDIASGDIVDGDKFFVSTRELANIIDDEQFAQICARYNGDELEQFFHTALVNHSDLAATHIISIAPVKSGIIKRTAAIDVGTQTVKIPENVFSASAYPAKQSAQTTQNDTDHDSNNTKTNSTPGQIYIHGDDTDTEQTPITEIISEHTHTLRKKLARAGSVIANSTISASRKTGSNLRKLWLHTTPIVAKVAHQTKNSIVSSTKNSSQIVAQTTKNITTTIATGGVAGLRTGANTLSQLNNKLKKHIQLFKEKRALAKDDKSAKNIKEVGETRGIQPIAQNDNTKTVLEKLKSKTETSTSSAVDSTLSQIQVSKLSASRFMQNIQNSVKPHNTKPPTQTTTTNIKQLKRVSAPISASTPITTPTPTKIIKPKHASTSSTPATKDDRIEAFFARPDQPTQLESKSKLAQTQNQFAQNQSTQNQTLAQASYSKLNLIKKFLPSPTRLTDAARQLSNRQRIIAAGMLVAIVATPIIISRVGSWSTKQAAPEPITDTDTKQTNPIELKLPVDASATKIAQIGTIITDPTIISLLSMREQLFAVTPTAITHISNGTKKQTYTMPTKFGKITHATTMDDLNMVLLVTDKNQIISFSLRARDKFIKNQITLPAGVSIDKVDTYLTYLYIFDNSANTIYRYPRATGGFGTARSWLKEKLNLTTNSTTIDGNMYVAQTDGSVKVFFRNKQIKWDLPQLTPTIKADNLFTDNEKNPLYINDRTNARIIAIDKNSRKVTLNLTNEYFRQIRNFTIDERTRTITALLDNGAITTYRF